MPATPRPGPSAPLPHPATTTPGRGGTRASGGQGTARGTQARGQGGAPSEGRHPGGQGTGRDTTWGQETTQEAGRGRSGDRGTEERAPRQTPRPTPRKGIPRRGDQRRPTPTERRTTPRSTPPITHHRSKHRTPYGSHQRKPTSHRKPHGGWRAHLHGENGLHPQRKPQGTPPRGAPPRPHRQATTPAATRATSQALEEDEGTATATRARDRDPEGKWNQGTGPQRGRPHGRLPDRPARAARPGPHSTDPARYPHLTAPPSHQPATLRQALRTTTKARLTSTDPPRHNARQHGTPHHSAPQCNAPQHDARRRGTERHNTARLTLT